MRTQLLALSLLLCLCMQGCAGKAENIPPELLAFAESYPQAAEFVRNYPNEAGREHEIDISGELTGGIPLFLQWDTRWGYVPYGDGWIGNNGCGPTSLSMRKRRGGTFRERALRGNCSRPGRNISASIVRRGN